MEPRESRKSRISATRMEVSWRQNQRAQPITPMPTGAVGPSSTGAVDSCAPAAASAASAASDSWGVSMGALSVVLMCV